MNHPLPSIQRRILSSIALVLLTLALVLTGAFGFMNDRQSRSNLMDRMDIAMQVAWQAYQEAPHQLAASIQGLAALPAFRDAVPEGPQALRPFLDSLPRADFAALVADDRRVLGHTALQQGGSPAPFPHIVDEALRKGAVQYSTELVTADWVAAQMPMEQARLNIPQGCSADSSDCARQGLVQVAAVPVGLGASRQGVVIAGILLNNTHDIPRAASSRIPGAYLSIAGEGWRVSSNINTEAGPLSTGGHQSAELVNTVTRGERYYGTVPVNMERHYVASDPIYNASGQVIGALSLGLPPSGYVEFRRGTQTLIIVFALVAVLVSMLVARFISRRLAHPIVALQQDVMRLASAHGPAELQQAAAQILPANSSQYSQEVLTLHNSFRTLAESLVNLTRETEAYLKQVEGDKAELEAMTEQLQESKVFLERKVEERTQELEQVVLELRSANAMKSRFLATMSHELRTPLNSVIGFSEMIADELVGPVTPKQQEYLGHILSSARHLLQLISDILDLSRIEQGRLAIELQEVLLHELVASIKDKVRPQAEANGLSLKVEADAEVPPIVADPTRIKEVLFNLLSNAIKFTPDGGLIWVRLRQAGEMALLEVEDTGIGMKPEDQEVVFNEFVQGESAYHRRFEGVGLGLPLSKKLVELHGGRIELESKLGRGTRVRVYLPLRKGDEQ